MPWPKVKGRGDQSRDEKRSYITYSCMLQHDMFRLFLSFLLYVKVVRPQVRAVAAFTDISKLSSYMQWGLLRLLYPVTVLYLYSCDVCYTNFIIIGPIPWGHSGPLCHALSVSSSSLSLSLWTSHAACAIAIADVQLATPGDWQCNGGSHLANGPNIFQMLLVFYRVPLHLHSTVHHTVQVLHLSFHRQMHERQENSILYSWNIYIFNK